MDAEPKSRAALAQVIERLHDPLQLRVALAVIVLLVWYVGGYLPLSGAIEETTRGTARTRKRVELARDIERLRAQAESFRDRLPGTSDPNEWIEDVLDGVREFPGVKLGKFEPEPIKNLGPYKLAALRIELEGTYDDLAEFLRWLETNDRLIRVDHLSIDARSSGAASGSLIMRLSITGVMG